MAEFEVFELRGGWIQGLGRIHFKEFPARGESVEIAGADPMEVRRYEVHEVELSTDSTSAGSVVLTPIPKPNGPHPFPELPVDSTT
jgi:hypothetical protein